jgi:HEAT repeat protein
MPRKISKNTTTTDKKYTTVPPKAKPVSEAATAPTATAVAVAPVAVTAVVTTPSASPVTQAATKPAVVTDLSPLLAALRNLDADVAREAATALGRSGNPAAVAPLIEIVQNSNGYFHSVVRSAAAAGLGLLKDKKAVDALLVAVNDPITDASSEAVRALAAIGDARAVDPLVAVVRNETGFFAGSVRRAAVLGLAQLGGPAAQAVLREVAANELEDSVIREEAIEAINTK